MTTQENLDLAILFVEEGGSKALYEKVCQFISMNLSIDRFRVLSVVKPLMGGDKAQDERITEAILNG